MLKRLIPLLAVTLITGCATLGGGSQSMVIRAKDKVVPALVHVRPVKEVYTSGTREEVAVLGSGFLITGDGYVVTNEHVAGEARQVRCVLYNQDEVDAEVTGIDPYTDIAVLKLKTDRTNLPHVKLGDSSKIKQGQTVLAMGSPHGLSRSVSEGIISVTDRYLPDTGDDKVSPFNTWIQTDAAINQGNSGGPLVNTNGEVIGINARMLANAQNVGFAIPINVAREVIEQIIKNGRVSRSWIGETLQPMTAKTNDPNQKGVVIADLDPASPGYEAGLHPGDILLALNGKPLNARFEEDLPAVRKAIADMPVGAEVTLTVSRNGETKDVAVTTIERSQLRGQQAEFKEWAFTGVDLTPILARQAQLPLGRGVLVTGTQVGGIADSAHLDTNDIILRVDGTDVAGVDGLKNILKPIIESGKRLVMLEVKRGALTRFVLVKQESEPQAQAAGSNMTEGESGLVD